MVGKVGARQIRLDALLNESWLPTSTQSLKVVHKMKQDNETYPISSKLTIERSRMNVLTVIFAGRPWGCIEEASNDHSATLSMILGGTSICD
ncbi:hypothetical protein SMICM304S_05012 [Streptomyces microflavus]